MIGARRQPVALPRPSSGRSRDIVMLLGTVALVVAASGLMVWVTSDAERRAFVLALLESPVGLLVLFGLSAVSTATLILPAPGLALTAMAGTIADPLSIGLVAGLGQALGELTGYLAGERGRALLPDSSAMQRLTGWMQRRGMLVIFVLALVPNPVFDVAGIAAGAIRMGMWRYLGAAAAGKVIKNIAVAAAASILIVGG